MIALGLTGNLGSGKSSVAGMLRERGAEVLDADRLVHAMLAEGGEAVDDVLAAFPRAAAPGGASVDRRALASVVFADDRARRVLESILHPLVLRREHEWLEQCRARGARLAVVEATLLLEAWAAGGEDPRERFDAIVAVTCDEATQVARAVARGVAAGVALDAAERDARARLAAQMPQAEKAALADHVIDNSGPLEATAAQVDALVEELERGNGG